MLFNPFKYQFEAEYIREENTFAVLRVRRGTTVGEVYFPKDLLPPELKPGESTALLLEPPEALKKGEEAVMKTLLEELIR